MRRDLPGISRNIRKWRFRVVGQAAGRSQKRSSARLGAYSGASPSFTSTARPPANGGRTPRGRRPRLGAAGKRTRLRDDRGGESRRSAGAVILFPQRRTVVVACHRLRQKQCSNQVGSRSAVACHGVQISLGLPASAIGLRIRTAAIAPADRKNPSCGCLHGRARRLPEPLRRPRFPGIGFQSRTFGRQKKRQTLQFPCRRYGIDGAS